jgi:copper transport protein
VRRLLVVLCALAALLLPAAPASAHAFLLRAQPGPGDTVRTAPSEIHLFFSEPVEPAAGIRVTRAGGIPVTAGKPFVAKSNPREIVVPLQSGLGNSPYAVQWSEVDQEDGHLVSGAYVFTVGGGLPPIRTAASASQTGGGPSASGLISRWLLLAGLLVAAGTFAFATLVARRHRLEDALVLTGALAVATLGAVLGLLFDADAGRTRYGHWLLAGACVGAAATALAAASLRRRELYVPAGVLAVVLLALPTATGHASATGATHALSIPADIAHLAAAAVWIGGIVALALAPSEQRGALARRFGPYAIAAVALLGVTGILRAYDELAAFSQIWSTSYGRALLVKTALFAVLLVLGFLNRRRLRSDRLGVELVLLAVVVGAVAVLVNVRPGVARAVVAGPTESQTVVYAGQDNDLAVGLAATPHGKDAVELKATVLGRSGPRGGLGLHFSVDGRTADAEACGAGCYRATVPVSGSPHAFMLSIDGRSTMGFEAPAQWPATDGLDLVRKAEETITSLRTLVVHSQLASDNTHSVQTIYKMVSPNRLSYHNVGGADSVLIGNRRWDRNPGKAWVASPQFPPIRQPSPFWPSEITDAHVVRTDRVDGHDTWVVSFLDPNTPAWFTAWIDTKTYRTLRLDMVAAAHFMHDRDGPFNAPISVDAPAS